MGCRKLVSIVLLVAQANGVVWAGESVPASVQPSPETDLLVTIFALQGADLSKQEAQKQLSAAVSQYNNFAPLEQRSERFEKALVELGVYSSEQAKTFVEEAGASGQRLDVSAFTGSRAAHQLVSAEITSLTQLHPTGAQFSQCAAGQLTAVGGIAALVTGLVLATALKNCQGNGVFYDCNEYVCDSYGNCQYITQCEEQTCDHPHATVGKSLAIAGGVATLVGAIIMMWGDGGCSMNG